MSNSDFEQLLIRYEAGNCTKEEEVWIENWLQEHDIPTGQIWTDLKAEERQQYLAGLFQHIEQHTNPGPVGLPEKPKNNVVRWLVIVVAAACILLFFLIDHFHSSPSWQLEDHANITWASAEAPVGTRKQITLEDGTQVWLQGGTKLLYPRDFSKRSKRYVRLEGEGYFEVASNPDKPFIVETKGLAARVVGTSFNIEAYPELKMERINLIEGKLSVRKNKDGSNKEYLIHASESIMLNDSSSDLALSTMSTDQLLLDYKSGILNFNNTDLSVVLFRISKAYGILIEVDSKQALKQSITGTFEVSEPIEEVLQSVAQSIGARIRWKDRKVLELIIE